ncbi:hypothetical protein DFH09DRAFT_18576 [Mycena vulgaris]|nr:hypothetical protein DFH09DRAFT_18576 [Mycena vulgaris]
MNQCATARARVFPRLLLRQLSRMHTNVHHSPRVPRRSIDHEVVEDSEPEREALRQTQRLERKRKKLASMHPELADTAEKSGPSKVIEISDESVPASPLGKNLPPTSPIGVIDISDSSASMSKPCEVVNMDIVSLHSSMSATNPSGTVGDATDMDIVPHVAATHAAPPSDLGHSDDEEILPTLHLGHFAFTNPRPLQTRNFSSSAGSNSDTQAKASKTGARSSSKRLAGDFSEAELKKLVKCVSCDIAWTARKSGAQKLVHIRSCAKKNGFTDDTVRILIRKEVDNAANDAGPSKRKGKALEDAPTTRTTLLEDVVREAAPKRKGKRKETVDALKSVSETRETVLSRARMLLGSGLFSDENVQTQAFTTAPTIAPEPIQAFGHSRLGQRQGSKLSLFGEQDSDGELDLPPATQVFAPSKLGAKPVTGTSGRWGYESESECESSASASDMSLARKSNQPLASFPFSAKEVSPRSPKATRNTSAAILPCPAQPGSDEWDDDDAYVHYDPELNKKPFSKNIVPTQKPKESPKTTREGRGTKSPKSRRRAGTLAETHSFAVPATSKAKRSRKKDDDEFGDSWELELKDKIIKDRDLHLRILRYEPINFEAFLQLATPAGEIAGGRLKLKLRVFWISRPSIFMGRREDRAGDE